MATASNGREAETDDNRTWPTYTLGVERVVPHTHTNIGDAYVGLGVGAHASPI